MPRTAVFLLALATALPVSSATYAGEPADGRGARVNNLKVISDKIDDVTTAENILKSFLKPGLSDLERSRALWLASVKYRHQAPPPDELLAADWEAHDPVKLFNVYGYCMCCCTASLIEALNRLDGREARGRILTGHSVAEVKYGGGWHMFDPSLIDYFPRPDGDAASVDDIAAAVRGWYAGHPDYRGKPAKLAEVMRSDGWTGWQNKGPALLARCPFYHLGWLPARTHGWDATMVEYDRRPEVYEYGYQVGHRALFSLRPGESFVREAGNRGLHVNREQMPDWDGLRARAPEGDLVYLKQFFPGYHGSLVANGYHRYAPDLAAGQLAAGALVYDNLTAGGSPALQPREVGKPAVAVVALDSPYVYLGGRLTLKAVRRSAADRVVVSLSTNHGRTFTPLWQAEPSGASAATIALGDRILRRYAYRLKIEMVSATPGGAGLDGLAIENDIQHAPRTLPWLGRGVNTITVAADGDPAQASLAVVGRITPDANFARNESTNSLGVQFENLKVEDGSCWWRSGVGRMTVPVQTPGDLTALRFCTQFRARGPRDLIRVLVSFDGGKTWQEAGRLTGPTPGSTEMFRLTDLPPGTRRALVRYELGGNDTIGIFSFRIDADFRDPLAAPAFRPFQVVHRWKEQGRELTHRAAITRLPFTYRIVTTSEPEMVSVSYGMP